MVTTKQVRDVIRRYGKNDIWTNKLKDVSLRSVKCYAPWKHTERDALLAELYELAGPENVRVTTGSSYFRAPGIIVRCALA